jgi:Asp-tRNA(Asn)/Glu-tRNA(Gln) amidotransferase A subunit family amidase
VTSAEMALDERLARVAIREPELQALVAEPDRQGRLQRETAAVADDAPLRGWFLAVKDILHANGLVTRAGTSLPEELFAGQQEAACVAALRGAGCVVLGKTVTTEFAYFEPGPTCNPHDPAHTPGGSSSGSAAAIAAGYCQLALGTQTVGSVIRPAAFCGVVGFKPSYGRVSTDGLLLCAPSVDTVGLFAATVEHMQRGAEFIVEGWTERVVAAAELPILGVPEGPYLAQASAEGLQAFAAQVEKLERAGYVVRRPVVLENINAINTRHGLIQAAEMALEHASWMAEHLHTYRPRTREILLRGQQIGAVELEVARSGRQQLRQALLEVMDDEGIDLWICPAAPGPAPRGLASTGDPVMNLPWTHAGIPAVSLPAGLLGKMPVGLQCLARHGEDEQLLSAARGLAPALT